MKHATWAVLVCALAAPAMAQTANSGTAKSAMATKLMAAENTMLDDLTKHDRDAFFAWIAPGSWSVDEGGLMKIDDFRQAWDQLKIESSKTSDMRVVPIGASAAIVTYKLEQKGSMAGQAFPPVVYASTVWALKNGKWQAMFHQESTPRK